MGYTGEGIFVTFNDDGLDNDGSNDNDGDENCENDEDNDADKTKEECENGSKRSENSPKRAKCDCKIS